MKIGDDIMLMGFLVVVLLIMIIITWRDSAKKIANTEIGKSELPTILHTYRDINYLGGHPLVPVGSVNEGTLYISQDKIFYMDSTTSAKMLFELSMNNIIRCSIENKESLTAGRILLVGILAWAFKKNTSYIRIEFNDELGNVSNLIIVPTQDNSDQAAEINANINQLKMSSIAI
ncbi:hypothetical protein J7E73_13830 [Paenibacillus albidus]|uniref:hypothetical protein n=1 Tax=Paenibacillus albidus TaxID=2041023 RepID=UPI001BE65A22|nr:hypothetical protein [Paenibacillus albidus]MBT2290202.1 hypothetical protein [Paenibacillus albidus]